MYDDPRDAIFHEEFFLFHNRMPIADGKISILFYMDCIPLRGSATFLSPILIPKHRCYSGIHIDCYLFPDSENLPGEFVKCII